MRVTWVRRSACKQDREDDKDRYRSDVDQYLCKPNDLRAELQIHRCQTSESQSERQYRMYKVAEAHGRHRSCHSQYCENREQQDGPFAFVIRDYSANR